MKWLRIARASIVVNCVINRIILILLASTALLAMTAPLSYAAVSVQWNGVPSLVQSVTPSDSVVVMPGSFTVISETSCYDVSADVVPRLDGTATSWNQPGVSVIMDPDNFVVASIADYAAAFDLRATDNNQSWRAYQTGGTDVVILTSMPITPPSGRSHEFHIALVLVEFGE